MPKPEKEKDKIDPNFFSIRQKYPYQFWKKKRGEKLKTKNNNNN
jgi:hypothetical protein